MSSKKTDNAEVSAMEVAKKRWKYIGYRGFTEFIASDNDFFILRRFRTLTVRVLLALQDELCELEGQLHKLEDQLFATTADDVHNGSFRQETSQVRLDLVREIDRKLRAYNELVIQHTDIRSRPDVQMKDVNSVSTWFQNNRHAVLDEETGYIKERKDLFAVVPKVKTPLRRFLERSTRFRLLPFWKKSNGSYHDKNVHYMSDRRIDLFVGVIITLVGLAMLIAPLWILAFVSSKVYRLAIITSFVGGFLCFVSFTTVAKPFETLGAAAAYAAVLVVFLQIM